MRSQNPGNDRNKPSDYQYHSLSLRGNETNPLATVINAEIQA
ncbi:MULTISPECIES: hypothetical protein [Moorena]|nr:MULTISPECIES: hypothetical protein [Moorena]